MEISPEIRRVRQSAEAELLARPGVTGVDIVRKKVGGRETDIIAIEVSVEKKRDVPPDQAIPTTIEGVPTDVVERTCHFISDDARYDPLSGGISIGPLRLVSVRGHEIGTLGCITQDNESGDKMLLSNFHVLCVDNNWSTSAE